MRYTYRMKKCIACGIEKPLSAYKRARANKPYLMRSCKTCDAEKLHANYIANREERLAKQKVYVASRPEENRLMHRKAHERRMQDPEWVERQRARNREYGRANREKRRLRQKLRLERLASCEINDFTPDQWTALVEAHGGRCAYCGVIGLKLETEHVIPLCRGGNNTARNIVPACSPCNLKKWTKINVPFLIIPDRFIA